MGAWQAGLAVLDHIGSLPRFSDDWACLGVESTHEGEVVIVQDAATGELFEDLSDQTVRFV